MDRLNDEDIAAIQVRIAEIPGGSLRAGVMLLLTELRLLKDEFSPNQKRIQVADDGADGLDWLLEQINAHHPRFFNCDCDPSYESDTNAYNHSDNCASLQEDHLEITAKQLREMAGAQRRYTNYLERRVEALNVRNAELLDQLHKAHTDTKLDQAAIRDAEYTLKRRTRLV